MLMEIIDAGRKLITRHNKKNSFSALAVSLDDHHFPFHLMPSRSISLVAREPRSGVKPLTFNTKQCLGVGAAVARTRKRAEKSFVFFLVQLVVKRLFKYK